MYVRTYVRSSAQARTSRQVNLNFLPSSSDESDLRSSTSNQMLYCNFAAMLYFDQHQNSTTTRTRTGIELLFNRELEPVHGIDYSIVNCIT